MPFLRTAASPAFLFDLALVAVVVTAGLVFDHVMPQPSEPAPQFAQKPSTPPARS